MKPEDIKPQDAPRLLQQIVQPETVKITDYLEGRWLGPEGREKELTYWTGPMLPSDHDEYASMKEALVKAVAADNLPRSSIETYLDAVEGLEDWRLALDGQEPPEDQTDDEAAMTAYTDRMDFPGFMYRLGLTLAAHARTVARPILSARARDEEGQIKPARDLAEALSRIHWQAPGWPQQSRMVRLDQAGIYLDPQTLEPVSLLSYAAPRDNGQSVPGLELSWVDPDTNLTHLRVLERGETEQEATKLNLGGRLMLLEATLARPIVTRSMLGAMDAYIVASTMLNRNTHYAGFVERYAVNVMPPGNWETGPDGKDRFVPAQLDTGPARMNFYQASSTIETITENGVNRETERPAAAQVGRWEPVDPKAITAALDHWRKAIRAEARQSFLEMTDSATASGRSREVAAGDYLRAAERIKDAETGLVRDFLELTLHLAALQLSDTDASRLRSYRASVSARVKAFPPSAEERKVILLEWQAGLIDHESALTESGRDDPDMLLPKIQAEAALKAAAAQALIPPPTVAPVVTE